MKFPIVYYDPPWQYRVRSRKGLSRSAENYYPTQPLDYIKAMPIPDLADRHSVHLMWATYPNLAEAFELWRYWGITYKTVAFTWVKTNKNWLANAVKLARALPQLDELLTALLITPAPGSAFMIGNGYYTRANPEVCLLGTTGKGLSRIDQSVRNLIVAPHSGKHSEKPEETAARIDQLFGSGIPKIEVFGRRYRPGWVSIGNDLDGLDIADSISLALNNRIFSVDGGLGVIPKLEDIYHEYNVA